MSTIITDVPSNATGRNNFFWGTNVGLNVTTSFDNILIGAQAGLSLTGGGKNVIIGGDSFNTGSVGNLGNFNTCVGTNNMDNGQGAIGDYNIVVGNANLQSTGALGNSNIIIGARNFVGNNTTTNSVLIGFDTNTSISNVVVLGKNTQNVILGGISGSITDTGDRLQVRNGSAMIDVLPTTANVKTLVAWDNTTHQLVVGTGTAGGLTTADNGLTANTASNVRLGGTLIQNTTVAGGLFTLNLSGSHTTNQVVDIFNTSTGIAAKIEGTGGYGAVISTLTGPSAASFSTSPASTNTIVPIIQINRTTSGTAAVGLGGSIQYQLNNASNQTILTNSLISQYTNVTAGAEASQFIITGINAGAAANLFTLSGNGALQLNKYGIGTFTGTATKTLQVDASGNVIETTPAVISANNGLTVNTPGNVQLGGSLIQLTTITAGTNTLTVSGALSGGGSTFNVSNSLGPSISAVSNVANGGTFIAQNTNSSANGNAIIGLTSGGPAINGQTTDNANTNTVLPVLLVSRQTAIGSVGNGVGGSIDYYSTTTATSRLAASLIAKFTNVTDASRTSQLIFTGVTNAVTSPFADMNGATANFYGTSVGIQSLTAGTGAFLIGSNAGAVLESPITPVQAANSSTSTNTVVTGVAISRQGGVYTGAIGSGLKIAFDVKDSNGANNNSGDITNSVTDVTPGAISSQFLFHTINSGASLSSFLIKSNGTLNAPQVATWGNFANNAAAITGGLATGDFYRNGDIVQIVH